MLVYTQCQKLQYHSKIGEPSNAFQTSRQLVRVLFERKRDKIRRSNSLHCVSIIECRFNDVAPAKDRVAKYVNKQATRSNVISVKLYDVLPA